MTHQSLQVVGAPHPRPDHRAPQPYRRLLLDLSAGGMKQIYSHQLASAAVATPAQVRRDLMMIGFTGSPRKGYAVDELVLAVNAVLAKSVETSVALVGVGNLGRADSRVLHEPPALGPLRRAFDREPRQGEPHHPRLPRLSHRPVWRTCSAARGIKAAVIAVPAARRSG